MAWTIFVYAVFASMVGAWRVLTNNHWVSDTIGGCFLAMAVCVVLIPRKID